MVDLSKMQTLPFQKGIESGVSTAFPLLALADQAGVRCGVSHLQPGTLDMDLTYDEVLYLLEGQVTLESEGESFPLAVGEALWMPANRHIRYSISAPSKMLYVIPVKA